MNANQPVSIRKMDGVGASGEVTFEVTMQPRAMFVPHWHDTDSLHPQAETEIYQWYGGSLTLWLRPTNEAAWSNCKLDSRDNIHLVVGDWHHAGQAGPQGAVFRVKTHASHVAPTDRGGNIHWLPMEEWPAELKPAQS